MDTVLKNSMEKLIDYAAKAGADSSDVILSKGESFSLSAQNEKIDSYKVSGSQVMGLRVIKDNKIGLSYSESIDDESLKQIAQAAVENASFGEENKFENINYQADEFIHQTKRSDNNLTTEEKINFCLSLEKEVKERDSRVSAVPYNGYSESDFSTYYLNSLGTFTYEEDFYNSCYTSALVNEGSESSMHYHSAIARNLSDLNKEECIAESLEHATNWLNAKPLATKNYDVIFTPDSFTSVFNCFTNIYSGKSAMEKTNPYAERLGEKVMNEIINVNDYSQYKDSFFHSYVDSEGVKHQDLQLIENGVLKNFYHNSATANYFKTQSTGHASRSAKSPLSVMGTTRVISAGKTSQSDIVSGEYFEVHSLQGLHSGANAISGEFSFGASGYLMKDGKRVQPVKGVTVSGNFYKMLIDIKILGDTILSNTDKSFFAPVFRFENMSIAGA